MANNPLKYIDPDGMRIIIGGQEWTVGATYDGDADSFGAKMFGVLNDIAANSTSGAEWLQELSSETDFEFRIEQTTGKSGFDPDNKPEIRKSAFGVPIEATIPEPGGGTAYINLNDPTVINTETGEETGNTEMIFAHEFIGHGIDTKRGQNDINNAKGTNLKKGEYTATERENTVRSEMGQPLRTTYGSNAVIRKSKQGVHAIPSGKVIRQNRRYKKP